MRVSLLVGAIVAAVACHAGPILNGDFETDDLTGWTAAVFPLPPSLISPPMPFVAPSDVGIGITGPSGASDDAYAVIDTTVAPGNAPINDIWGAISQTVTFNGVTGVLEFKLLDNGDVAPPVISNNHSGVLIDNVSIATGGGVDVLNFDWYLLTKADKARNDWFTVSFDGTELFRMGTNDNPLIHEDGGGGKTFGPFSYGTEWQSASIPVPEPSTWAILCCALIPLWRRRPGAA